jgi:dUTP pyrophosphatase
MSKKTITIKAVKLSSLAHIPAYATAHAAGMDLHAAIDKPVSLRPGQFRLLPSGLTLEIPPGFEGQVRPRSGLALKQGISIVNAPGTIDADYRGEIGVILINLGRKTFTVNPGDRIAQLVISPVHRVKLIEKKGLKRTERGTGGFGHTGVGSVLTPSLSLNPHPKRK